MTRIKHMLHGIQLALDHALESDPDVLLLGQDIAENGGVFRVTEGLHARYGSKRVVNMPIAENLMAGMSVGLAASGLKPVMEFQFLGFMYPALDQIINHVSRLRNRTRGRLSCPLVLRAPYGAGVGAPEHHSESTEAILGHIPGLRVIIPGRADRAYGLLRAAIQEPDPVIFLEPTRCYRTPCSATIPSQKIQLDKANH